MKRVYAIIGEKRTGKDTTADYICERLGCKKHALATPLKELVCAMFGMDMEKLDEYKNEGFHMKAQKLNTEDYQILEATLDVTFRSILQRCGDEQKRFFGLDAYMRKLHEKLIHEDVIVVPDVRLKEEQKWLMNNTNVTFIKIDRFVTPDKDSMHRTEKEVNELGYDIVLDNNGTIKELYAKIDTILTK